MEELRELTRIIDNIDKAIRRLPAKAATVAINFSQDRFLLQNWVDSSRAPWVKRKAEKWGRKARKGRALLVDSGRLRRSIRRTEIGEDYAIIGTDVPYARVHNEGYKGNIKQTVKAHTRKISRKMKVAFLNIETRKTSTRTQRLRTGTANVKSYKRTLNVNIPKRQFIGQSALLDRQLEKMITKELINAMK